MPNKTQNSMQRPPVVVVMGHVDHGKTSLLDYIRKTNIAAREAGGITQSVGAYEIVHNGKKITFIDTPGHEAFSNMRERGANVADMAILIVAADDGVQPQTKESIEVLQNTKTPFVVAINKVDKANADIEKTKNDLMQHGVYLEGYGGTTSWQAISAKQGTGVDDLLDHILLAAEIEGFTYNSHANAQGVILEAKLDTQRGITAIGILKNGILKTGKAITTPTASGKIKIIEDFKGVREKEFSPSSPVLILGFDSLPKNGEEFISGDIEIADYKKSEVEIPAKKEVITTPDNKPALNLIIKSDVSGSLEALGQIIRSLDQTAVKINILGESVGEISDGDVKAANTNGAIIAAFNTKVSKSAENLAKTYNIKIINARVIYELIKLVEDEIKAIEKPAPLGTLTVLATFSQKNKKQLVGGKVETGLLKSNIVVKIVRDDQELGLGRITNLRSGKKEITQMEAENECGVMIESNIDIQIGDQLIYELQKRTS